MPEAHGGAGGNAVDTLVIMEALGRRLVVEPYLPTVVLGAGLVARAGSDAQRARLLPAVGAGTHLLALAHDERDSRYELAQVTKKWAGLGKELFTTADNYVLKIADGLPADDYRRQLIVGAVMCIDMVLKE